MSLLALGVSALGAGSGSLAGSAIAGSPTQRGKTTIEQVGLSNIGEIRKNIAKLIEDLDPLVRTEFERGLQYLSDDNIQKDGAALQPFIGGGTEAFNQALGYQGLGPNPISSQDLQDRYLNSPGTQFALEQGRRAIDSSAAVRGLLGSGSQAKELTRFGQGHVGQYFQQQQDNLSRLAGYGANAAAQFAAIGQQNRTQSANLLATLGSTLAQNRLLAENMRTSTLAKETMSTKQQFGSMERFEFV